MDDKTLEYDERTIVFCLDLDYTPPSRHTIARRLKQFYKEHHETLIADLKKVDFISITTDCWTNRRMKCFVVMSGHYCLPDTYEMKSTILDFATFNKRHSSKEISMYLEAKMKSLGIIDKIVCVTADGARNMTNAIDSINFNGKRFWCMAHRLHLTITNALGLWLKNKAAGDDLDSMDELGIVSIKIFMFYLLAARKEFEG